MLGVTADTMGRHALGSALPVTRSGPEKRIVAVPSIPPDEKGEVAAFRVGPKTLLNHQVKAISRIQTPASVRALINAIEAAQKKERAAGKKGQIRPQSGIKRGQRLYFLDQRGTTAIGKVIAVTAAWVVMERKFSRSYNRSNLVAVRHDDVKTSKDALEETTSP